MFLAQSLVPWIPDSFLILGALLLAGDKCISFFKKRTGFDPIVADAKADTIIKMMGESKKLFAELKADLEHVKRKSDALDKSHHDSFARNEDGSYKWHNHTYIQDKIKSIEKHQYDLEKKVDDLIQVINLLTVKIERD